MDEAAPGNYRGSPIRLIVGGKVPALPAQGYRTTRSLLREQRNRPATRTLQRVMRGSFRRLVAGEDLVGTFG